MREQISPFQPSNKKKADFNHFSVSILIRHGEASGAYLEVVLAVYREPVAEYVPGDHHVSLHAVHRQPVHTQELRQQCVAMTLHYELRDARGR